MADEPDNLILKLLREIRTKQDGSESRLDKIQRQLDEMHEGMISALGFSAHANIRHDGVGTRLDKLEARVTKLEDEPV